MTEHSRTSRPQVSGVSERFGELPALDGAGGLPSNFWPQPWPEEGEENAAFDAFVLAAVDEALNDPQPPVSSSEAFAQIQAHIMRHRDQKPA
jgi:hypothetical protein